MIEAWHFVGKKLRDGKPIPKDGVWLEHTGPIVMCRTGLHASIHPYDALKYAPGVNLCRVECDGEIIQETDKLVCSRRRIVTRKDATEGLRYFARMQALSVAHLWEPPQVVLEYLVMGGNKRLRDAAAYAAADAAYASYANSYVAYVAYATTNAASYAAYAATAAAYAAYDAYDTHKQEARDMWQELVYEAFGLDKR